MVLVHALASHDTGDKSHVVQIFLVWTTKYVIGTQKNTDTMKKQRQKLVGRSRPVLERASSRTWAVSNAQPRNIGVYKTTLYPNLRFFLLFFARDDLTWSPVGEGGKIR